MRALMPAANPTPSRISRASLVAVPPYDPDDGEVQLQRLTEFLVPPANTSVPPPAPIDDEEEEDAPPVSQIRPIVPRCDRAERASSVVSESSDDVELVQAWCRGERAAATA